MMSFYEGNPHPVRDVYPYDKEPERKLYAVSYVYWYEEIRAHTAGWLTAINEIDADIQAATIFKRDFPECKGYLIVSIVVKEILMAAALKELRIYWNRHPPMY